MVGSFGLVHPAVSVFGGFGIQSLEPLWLARLIALDEFPGRGVPLACVLPTIRVLEQAPVGKHAYQSLDERVHLAHYIVPYQYK